MIKRLYPILFFTICLLLASACKNANSTSDSNNEATSNVNILSTLETFPFDKIEDMVSKIPADEWQQLVSKKESQNWIVKERKGASISIENKTSADNYVTF